jgi:hypothetical protein
MTIIIVELPVVLTLPLGEMQKKAIAASVIAVIYVMLLALSCIFFLGEDLTKPLHTLNKKLSEIMSNEEGEMDVD